LDAKKPFLGICLGAQMLAKVLGGSVDSRPDGLVEIGYYPLYPTPQGQTELGSLTWVYHWHKEGLELPTDAVRLARGDRFDNQAFRYGNHTYGLQFHPEMQREAIQLWTVRGAEQLSFPGAQPPAEQLQKYELYGQQAANWLPGFLRSWLRCDRSYQQNLISNQNEV
jgi:GMP synthase (glutamine-hydrolysing)